MYTYVHYTRGARLSSPAFLRAVPASRWPSLPGFMFGRNIEGEDQDKLSDCRGQVVRLYFWSDY